MFIKPFIETNNYRKYISYCTNYINYYDNINTIILIHYLIVRTIN